MGLVMFQFEALIVIPPKFPLKFKQNISQAVRNVRWEKNDAPKKDYTGKWTISLGQLHIKWGKLNKNGETNILWVLF